MEVPSIVPQPSLPPADSSIPPPEVSLPTESSVSEISSMVPPVEEAEMVPAVPEASLLPSEIPEIPPTEVIATSEEPVVPPAPIESEVTSTPVEMPQMENMGYDQVSFVEYINICTI